MFRVYDAQAGQPAPVAAPPGGLLRVYVGGPPPGRGAHAGELRSLLVADLIRRNCEHRHDVQVITCLVIPDSVTPEAGDGAGYDDAFRADASALNLRPAEQAARASDLPAPAAGLADGQIAVGSQRVQAAPVLVEDGPAGAAAVTPPPAVTAPAVTAPAVTLSGMAERGLDPLALRLAFWSCGYREPAVLSWDTLGEADQMLRRWRELVAEWAESPSHPPTAEVTARVTAAVDDDLDTPAALQALEDLAGDPGIAAGSKFETFVYADQVLALDLPRDIGRIPRRRNNSSS